MREDGTIRRAFWALALVAVVGIPELRAQGPDSGYELAGRAFYEEVPVGPEGLDPAHSAVRPIRGALLEVVDPLSGARIAGSETDAEGRFVFQVPAEGTYRVRVVSKLVSDDVVVLDNASDNQLWSVSADAVTGEPLVLVARDDTRVAGAFNILDVIRRANDFVRALEADLELPPLRVFWSPLNTDDPNSVGGRFVGGTWFDSRAGFAVVLGDRNRDSDEFDDDVILHEYAHFLAARFSRDDSPGGPHAPGDVLDPRVAWSEGWADFFSGLVSGDPVYRDAYSDRVLEYDLESNMPGSGVPGYWSERTVHAFLWDLADAAEDPGDGVQVELDAIWRAFRSLTEDAFVYLPTFLDHLAADDDVDASSVEQLARIHSLDYVAASGRRAPSFPKVIDGRTATGELDSWSSRRANLARSAHLYTFSTSGGAVAIDLEVTGLGSARNAAANNLDLFLMDSEGQRLRASTSGGDGEPERISTFLPQGTYVVEIRSFFRRSARQPREFNSGTYRMTINRP